jgi:hypothetical protein
MTGSIMSPSINGFQKYYKSIDNYSINQKENINDNLIYELTEKDIYKISNSNISIENYIKDNNIISYSAFDRNKKIIERE